MSRPREGCFQHEHPRVGSAVAWHAVSMVRSGLAELILSPPILEEFRGVLCKKFAMTKEDAEENIAVVREFSMLIEVPGTLRVVADDPEDDKFIETAMIVGAQCVVSGDKHLLRLGEYRGIKVLSARAFLDRLAEYA